MAEMGRIYPERAEKGPNFETVLKRSFLQKGSNFFPQWQNMLASLAGESWQH